MGIVYQSGIIAKATEIVELLVESKFYEENEIKSTDFSMEYLLEKLTEKFISGEPVMDDDYLFSDEDFDVILKEILVGSHLSEIKRKGYINTYSDENTDEIYFITEQGKNYLKSLKEKDL